MKTYFPYFLAVLLAIAVYLHQERRIAALKSRLPPKASRHGTTSVRPNPGIQTDLARRQRAINASEALENQGGLPPREELIKMGFEASLGKMYGEFIDSLQLSEDERRHLEKLLIDRLCQRRELETRWLSATPTEKAQILREVRSRQPQNTAAISSFLNHPDDVAAFLKYERELPERQSLANFTFDEEVRQELIGALCGLRIASGEGPTTHLADLDSIRDTGNTDVIRKRWEIVDQNLPNLLSGILSPEETETFLMGWRQVRETQLKEYAAAIHVLGEEEN